MHAQDRVTVDALAEEIRVMLWDRGYVVVGVYPINEMFDEILVEVEKGDTEIEMVIRVEDQWRRELNPEDENYLPAYEGAGKVALGPVHRADFRSRHQDPVRDRGHGR